MRFILTAAAVMATISPGVIGHASAPQAGPPATEVFLAPLSLSAGKLIVGEPRNISNSPGYDNQPFFTPDGRSVLFTSARGPQVSKCGSPQTDIYRYGVAEGQLAQVTGTPDCEYSPTVMPGGTRFSVIRVEPDGTQRLWQFGMDGKNPRVILENVKPVGYHAWLDDRRLVLFVLGQPATLQLADASTGTAEIVASDIGQSIVKMPGGGVTFVQQAGAGSDRTLMITQVTIENGKPVLTPLTTPVIGARQAHLAWTPDATLLMAHDGSLHAWRAGQSEWQVVADLGALGLRNVTRLAVSPKGNWLALVAQEEG
jgi:hypothetical protein